MMNETFQQTLDSKLNDIVDMLCAETGVSLSDAQRTRACFDLIGVAKAYFTEEKPYPGNSLIQAAIQVMTMKGGLYLEDVTVEILAARAQGELFQAIADELKQGNQPNPPSKPSLTSVEGGVH